MELKKSKKADLDRNKNIFLQIGLVLVLSTLLVAFEWTTKPKLVSTDKLVDEITSEVDEIIITRREEPKPEPIQQKIVEILNIVEDDVKIDQNIDINIEADQNTEFKFNGFVEEIVEEIVEEETFYIVEDMPTFNGGEPTVEFRKYIVENLKYPEIASENGVMGRVIVQFVINTKGKLVDAVVVPIDPALDKEALRVVMTSPNWVPGKQRGKPVRVLYTFPINFKLQ